MKDLWLPTKSVDLRHADCIEGLASLSDRSVDGIFADPPYNTGDAEDKSVHYQISAALEAQNWSPFFAGWDAEWKNPAEYITFSLAWLSQCRRVLKRKGSLFITGTYHCIGEISIALKLLNFYTVRWIYWHNPIAMPNRSMTNTTAATQVMIWARPYQEHSHIYQKDVARLYGEGVNLDDMWAVPDDVWSIPQDSALAKRLNKLGIKHPSKKPPKLIERALRLSCPKENALIVDPFAGSGTTGDVVRSMESYGWRCVLFEKQAEYIPIMQKRFEQPLQLAMAAA